MKGKPAAGERALKDWPPQISGVGEKPMQDLDSILNGETVEEPQAEAQPEPTQEVTQEAAEEVETAPEPVAETTEEPKGEEVGEPPAPEADERMVPQKALMDERRKRQELEAQLNSKDRKAPDVFEDQEAYTNHLNQQFNEKMLNERLNTSEFYARREFNDLDAKVEKFQEMVASNPALQQQVYSAVSPYHELYDIVSKAEQLEQMKDVDSYKASLRAEIEAEIKAEIEAEQKAKADLRESIPPSLNDVGSKGSLKGHNWSGPTSLDSILG